jgi:Protein of unknown function (DUF1036)
MKRVIFALIATSAVTLIGRNAFAWFQACNHHSTGGWVAYTHYIDNASGIQANDPTRLCGYQEEWGSCHYNTWKAEGWWRLEPGQCAILLGGDITNRYNYIRVDFDDGSYHGGGPNVYVWDNEFHWDEFWQNVVTGDCTGRASSSDCAQGYWTSFYAVDTGGAKNGTINLN